RRPGVPGAGGARVGVQNAARGLAGSGAELEDPLGSQPVRRAQRLLLELHVVGDVLEHRVEVALRREAVLRHVPTIAWLVVPLASVYPLVTARALARPFTYEVGEDVEPGNV